MHPYLAEFIGTAILILLGDGVVANVLLNKTKGNDAGWIVVTFGWGMGVFTAVFIVGQFSNAHINPAVTIGLAIAGTFEWGMVPGYIAAQMAGAFLGAVLVWATYRDHFDATENPAAILAVFSTGPAIRNFSTNFISEVIGTFLLVFGVIYMVAPEMGMGPLDALPVGLLVFAIGLSLGGTTGYAINPARDLGPRIVHALLPIKNKSGSDWGYSWVPVLGPLVGAIAAALLHLLLAGVRGGAM